MRGRETARPGNRTTSFAAFSCASRVALAYFAVSPPAGSPSRSPGGDRRVVRACFRKGQPQETPTGSVRSRLLSSR